MNFKIISCLSLTLLFFISCKKELKTNQVSKDGMVFIKGGTFLMGAGDDESREDEFPSHVVEVSSFWMDISEVTNKQFKKFVDETGYVTTAERMINWDEIKEFVPQVHQNPTIVYWSLHHLSLKKLKLIIYKITATGGPW